MILVFLLAIPLFEVNFSFEIKNNNIYLLVGTFFAIIGLVIEYMADIQLAQFRKNPPHHTKIMMMGLYRYSRHPNYFGESLFWLGIAVITTPFSYLGFLSFSIITFLLLFVSGIPMQERRREGIPEWEEYKKRTSIFIPWFPKK